MALLVVVTVDEQRDDKSISKEEEEKEKAIDAVSKERGRKDFLQQSSKDLPSLYFQNFSR